MPSNLIMTKLYYDFSLSILHAGINTHTQLILHRFLARLKELLLCLHAVPKQYVWRESLWMKVKVTVILIVIGSFVWICDFSNQLHRWGLPFSSWDPLCASDGNVSCPWLGWWDAHQGEGKRLTSQKWPRGPQGPIDRGCMWWMLFYCVIHTYSHATLLFVLLGCGSDVGGCVVLHIANDQCLNSPWYPFKSFSPDLLPEVFGI